MKHIILPVNHHDGIDLYGADKRVLSPAGMQEAVDAINIHDELVEALEDAMIDLREEGLSFREYEAVLKKPKEAHMVKAVYRAREDGDWDFVAAFDEQWITGEHDLPGDCNLLLGSDENCIVITAELSDLPEVLEGTSQLALEAQGEA